MYSMNVCNVSKLELLLFLCVSQMPVVNVFTHVKQRTFFPAIMCWVSFYVNMLIN